MTGRPILSMGSAYVMEHGKNQIVKDNVQLVIKQGVLVRVQTLAIVIHATMKMLKMLMGRVCVQKANISMEIVSAILVKWLDVQNVWMVLIHSAKSALMKMIQKLLMDSVSVIGHIKNLTILEYVILVMSKGVLHVPIFQVSAIDAWIQMPILLIINVFVQITPQ